MHPLPEGIQIFIFHFLPSNLKPKATGLMFAMASQEILLHLLPNLTGLLEKCFRLRLFWASQVTPIAFMARNHKGSLRSILGSSVRNPGYPRTVGGTVYLGLL